MKKIILLVTVFFISFQFISAQWTPLVSGTLSNLNDVHFIDANNGIAGGDSGVVLITTNGGMQWNMQSVGSHNNVGAVHMLSTDTFIVSYVDGNNIPTLSWTFNAGIYWQSAAVDSLCFRAFDTETDPAGKWITVASSLISTTTQGASWDTLMNYTCNTDNITRIQRTGGCYNAGGLQSGFTTYSASMIRSENNGISFWPYDPFSFLTSDALTAFDFPTKDTGYVFLNHYNMWVPGTRNSVRRLDNFQLVVNFPPDSMFTFNSTELDSTLPSYINDAKFIHQRGFAAAEDGYMYESASGGTNWTSTYTNNASLNRVSFPDEETGYAVGDSGTIIKYTAPTSVKELSASRLSIYPNPASTQLNVRGMKSQAYTIIDVNGRKMLEGKMENGAIDVQTLSKGVYLLMISGNNNPLHGSFVISR